MSLLEVRDLHTQFRTSRGLVKAVNGVDLTIDHGEMVGLVGESGSGKSVLAESIIKLVEDPGEIKAEEIKFKNEQLLDKSEEEMQSIRGNEISIIFQDPMNSLNPTLTIGEQVAETIRLHQSVGESVTLSAEIKRKIFGATKNSEAWERAIKMLEAVKIPNPRSRANNYPHEFSGGMRQRAMIATALSCEPDLLIADEPTTALDVTIQAQILRELKELQQEFDTSILMITHDLGVVAETCDKTNVMYAGEIVEHGTSDQVFTDPQHPYTEGLLKSSPRIDDPEANIEPIPGQVPEPIDIPYECHFAPRCPEAKRECYETKPDFRSVGPAGHEAACLRRGNEDEKL